jgi:replication factor A1
MYIEPLLTIVEIASKYDLDPSLLIESFTEAWKHQSNQCGDLKVTCRGVNKDEDTATFLVTWGETVVSQFSIKTLILDNQNKFKNHLQYVPLQKIRERYHRKDREIQQKIGQLNNNMKHVDLKAQIIEIPPVRRVMTRFGHQADLTNIKIADETGSIRLSLWNTQMQNRSVGDTVAIENGYVARHRGELQLRLGRKGTIN